MRIFMITLLALVLFGCNEDAEPDQELEDALAEVDCLDLRIDCYEAYANHNIEGDGGYESYLCSCLKAIEGDCGGEENVPDYCFDL